MKENQHLCDGSNHWYRKKINSLHVWQVKGPDWRLTTVRVTNINAQDVSTQLNRAELPFEKKVNYYKKCNFKNDFTIE